MTYKNYRPIIFGITCIFLIFNISQSVCASKENSYEKILSLEKSIQIIENGFYQTGELDSTQFNRAETTLNNVTREYFRLAERTSEKAYYERAFSFLEKRKNLKIISLLSTAKNRDSTKAGWQERLFENFQLCKKFENIKTKLAFDITKKDSLLFQLKKVEKSIQENIDSTSVYSQKLHYLLQLQKPVQIKEVQSYFRGHDEALLDFWVNGDTIAVFVVTRDTFYVNHWIIPSEIVKHQIHELMSPLYLERDLTALKFNCRLAFNLYEQLLQPAEKYLHSVKTIFFIPDDYLLSFPFEVLVTDSIDNPQDNEKKLYQHFRDVNFLIKKYAMLYNYSTTALNPEFNKTDSSKKLGRRLLTMSEPAPSLNWDNAYNHVLKKINPDFFEPSKFSSDEIRRVSRLLWRHDNLKGAEVTKKYLKEKGNNYRWLYLAQPSLLSNSVPFYSGVLFSEQAIDTMRFSPWLPVDEIMELNLSADMLTLSNCRLENPFLNRSDGVIILPEAFLFSGVHSVVNSFWSAEYIGTSQFMSKFYWELKYKRQWNVISLQSAKLASMKDTFHHGNKVISRAHPYFWANYRLVGNPYVSSPSNAWIRPWGVVIIVYFFVIIFVLLITKKTLPKVREVKS